MSRAMDAGTGAGHWNRSRGRSGVSQTHFASKPYTGVAPAGSAAKSMPTMGRHAAAAPLPRIATVNSAPGR